MSLKPTERTRIKDLAIKYASAKYDEAMEDAAFGPGPDLDAKHQRTSNALRELSSYVDSITESDVPELNLKAAEDAINAARAESEALGDADAPCTLCRHRLGVHNRIEGCRKCACLATPAEDRDHG